MINLRALFLCFVLDLLLRHTEGFSSMQQMVKSRKGKEVTGGLSLRK